MTTKSIDVPGLFSIKADLLTIISKSITVIVNQASCSAFLALIQQLDPGMDRRKPTSPKKTDQEDQDSEDGWSIVGMSTSIAGTTASETLLTVYSPTHRPRLWRRGTFPNTQLEAQEGRLLRARIPEIRSVPR